MGDKAAFQWAYVDSTTKYSQPTIGNLVVEGLPHQNLSQNLALSHGNSTFSQPWMNQHLAPASSQIESPPFTPPSPAVNKRFTNPFIARIHQDTLPNTTHPKYVKNIQLPTALREKPLPPIITSEEPDPAVVRAPVSDVAARRHHSTPTTFLTPVPEAQPPLRRIGHKSKTTPGLNLALVLTSGAEARNKRGFSPSKATFNDASSHQTTVPPSDYSSVQAPQPATSSIQANSRADPVQLSPSSSVTCATCRESCIPSSNPMADYLASTSYNNLPGLRLSCPKGHIYCIYCLRFHTITAMSPSSSEKKLSAPGCYQCANNNDPEWTIPLETLYTLFLPHEVSIWRWTKPSEQTAGTSTRFPDVHQDMKDNNYSIPKKDSRPVSTCGICLDQFVTVESPLEESSSKSRKAGKATLPVGLVLPCPGGHKYCLECITQHISTELKKGSEIRAVFPMRCPECAPRSWSMTDKVAELILDPQMLETWHFQKLLDSIAKIQCPHTNCSALVEVPDDSLRDATCPACQRMICVKCISPWHMGLTCAEYNQNDTDDQLIYDLAKRSGWRRCPRCRMIVERSSGCPHMSCRCGNQFCYRCGSEYKNGACNSGTGCREQPDPSFTAPGSRPPPSETVNNRPRAGIPIVRRADRLLGQHHFINASISDTRTIMSLNPSSLFAASGSGQSANSSHRLRRPPPLPLSIGRRSVVTLRPVVTMAPQRLEEPTRSKGNRLSKARWEY